jgi:hypothetical protein
MENINKENGDPNEGDSEYSNEDDLLDSLVTSAMESSKKLEKEITQKNKEFVEKNIEEGVHTRTNSEIDIETNLLNNMDIVSERQFTLHLQCKLDKLSNRLKILQIKYQRYKKWYDNSNIAIIIISSGLSVFEAFRNEISEHIPKDTAGSIIFNMVPIAVSTGITATAAIIKFKKYQEKMEKMQFTREKVILAISKIKQIQEELWFVKGEGFRSVKKKYMDDIYAFYNESSSELERHIKFSDYEKVSIKNDPFAFLKK